MVRDLADAVAEFGRSATSKLSNPGAIGQPEDQLRAPFEILLGDLTELAAIPRTLVQAVGETSLVGLQTRPDYAVTVGNALVGHVELKAPGKGADPRKFRDDHDKRQWSKLSSLPNLIYSDGNAFSLWRDGELALPIVHLRGDVGSSGSALGAPPSLAGLFEQFLHWKPIAPRSARELAQVSARLCRLLREEVAEQLALGNPALTLLAEDWRRILFPEATDRTFADGYAQAVTFGLLMARAKQITLSTGFHAVAIELAQTSTLIGAAMQLLTNDGANRSILKTSLDTLVRVLDAVDWQAVSKGEPETWLYFYEEFLEVYDNSLRKQTGSYYTPPEVVEAMVRLVDEELQSPRFSLPGGIASPAVTIVDPATGTGTFLLGILRRVASTVAADEGQGAVEGAINSTISRLIAFEMQLGPFAVAQLRLLAEIVQLTGAPPTSPPQLFVTDTLASPDDTEGWLPGYGPFPAIAESRKIANRIKREQPITVVIGNPPYKEKAKGMGGWVEGNERGASAAPLEDWQPPAYLGAHARHLRNLYVYFWRWATWKVFDDSAHDSGVVCFITAAGFLSGAGFQTMRSYLRRKCDQVWVIDCTPEGHQPDVSSRVFQGVQQPVCIVIASRSRTRTGDRPARTRFRRLPSGRRELKFAALRTITLSDQEWVECQDDWGAPFLPASSAQWSTFPPLESLFSYNGTGVMVGRTWVIAPDTDSLARRWNALLGSPVDERPHLFYPHLRNGKPGDKHLEKVVPDGLPGFPPNSNPVSAETGSVRPPIRYAFRAFDRQWLIPDSRLINQPNPTLWRTRSPNQIYITAPEDRAPTSGPAATVTGLVPDVHHYNGRGGRAFPLWADEDGTLPNVRPGVISAVSELYGATVSAEDVFAYIVALTGHPGFATRFKDDLATPGLRIPFTANLDLFRSAAAIGRRIVWLHTFGERMIDPSDGRPGSPPRMPPDQRPLIPADGRIPSDPARMPDSIEYDAIRRRLLIGEGFIENVSPEVWEYQVSGVHVLRQWFSYRRKHRERPVMGDRRPPSRLSELQPTHWLPEYTTELLNVLNVLGLVVQLEPEQARLLVEVCEGPLISEADLRTSGAFDAEGGASKAPRRRQPKRPPSAGGPRLMD